MVVFGVDLPAFNVNELISNLFGINYFNRLALAQLFVLIFRHLFVTFRPLHPLHSPAWNFIVFTGSFLSVCNPPLLEKLNVAVSDLEDDDVLDLDEVKLC